MAVATDKTKVSIYLDQADAEWLQTYSKEQGRSVSAQLGFMIRQLKKRESEREPNDA